MMLPELPASRQRGMDLDNEKPPAWIFKAALGLLVAFVGLAAGFVSLRTAPSVEPIAAPVSDRPTLVVFESASCGWCRRFRDNVAPDYERSHLESRAPLRYVDVGEQRQSGYRIRGGRITATPTFVLVDSSGTEVDRLRGLPGGRGEFIPAVERMLAKLP